jgi:hypothetical protein
MLLLFSSAPAGGTIFAALGEAADAVALAAQVAIQGSLADFEADDSIVLRVSSDIAPIIDPQFLFVAFPRRRTIVPKRP